MSGLTAVSKFSAIALGPIFLVLLTICVLRWAPWPCRIGKLPAIGTRLGRAAAGAEICWSLPHAGAPSGRSTASGICRMQRRAGASALKIARAKRCRCLRDWCMRVDKRRLLPNVYSQGFLPAVQGRRPRGLSCGHHQEKWLVVLFPLCISDQNPVSLILFLFGGLIFCALKWQVFYENALFVLVPLCLYMGRQWPPA